MVVYDGTRCWQLGLFEVFFSEMCRIHSLELCGMLNALCPGVVVVKDGKPQIVWLQNLNRYKKALLSIGVAEKECLDAIDVMEKNLTQVR